MRDQQIDRGKEWLETLLELMGISTEVTIGEDIIETSEPSSCWLIIDHTHLGPEQTEILVGYRGEGIDAIQYLANTVLNLGTEFEEQQAFTIEINSYRLKRQAELLAWAKRVADQVRQTGQEVEMKSLSSAERRQIHTFLKDAEDLATESRGQEPDRRLVVRLR
ncbi:single-stranded nucleic acid binding R3H domain protein [Gloeothece citriformis PCC 7424]|uniref:Single-stranded nucleic acid binding R3H domain protein n=1 Tax=Gloeothece citriformis (strain PCC 7424) TaxID=65393 RepID=B7KHE0_GLOC7|nr:R3H domain-containing nucleic acid-binding protein [Gloeothece citriformis]ACK69349.1 single-stranded nucleic acid binding R3H domain protein [Gloeothece citriformis PCC 7424]